MKFRVVNLGCKVNAYEADAVAQELEKRGFKMTEDASEADLTLIFTCAVTNTAAAKSRQAVHKARKAHPDTVIAAAGCYAQIDPDSLSDCEILIGTARKSRAADDIVSYFQDHQLIRDLGGMDQASFEAMRLDRFDNHARGLLRIQDGCNQFCTYCIIPYARGRERSMNPDEAVEEAKRLAQYHHEIVLSGIHTGRYGREYHVSLAQLIRRILDECPDLLRIRISSIEATEIDDDLIELLKEGRVAPHMHIPLQSGSDSVLARMHRPYNTAFYYAKIEKLRKAVPDISISTDIMTGFPGESDAAFEESTAFLKKCAFSFLHVFPYSERKGTPASLMKDQVPVHIRKQRAKACIELSDELLAAYQHQMLNHETTIITEARYTDTMTMGHSGEYLEVWVEGHYERGTVLHVALTHMDGKVLMGERVEYEAE